MKLCLLSVLLLSGLVFPGAATPPPNVEAPPVQSTPSPTAYDPAYEYAYDYAGDIESILDELDLNDWDEWQRKNRDSAGSTQPSLPSVLIRRLVRGELWDSGDLGLSMLSELKGMIPRIFALFLSYVGLAVLKAAADGIRPEGPGELAGTVIQLGAGLLSLSSVWGAVESCRAVLEGLGALTETLMPVLLALLTLFGESFMGVAQQSAMTLLGGTMIALLINGVLPLAVAGGVMGVFDLIGGERRIGGIGALCHTICRWLVGGLSSVYLLSAALRGAAASTRDSLLLRSSKLAAGGLPFVGGLVSDSLETAFACMRLVKNAIGTAAVVGILLYVVKPLAELLLHSLALKAAAALSRPLGAERYGMLLTRVSVMLGVMTAALSAAAALLAVTLGIAMNMFG